MNEQPPAPNPPRQQWRYAWRSRQPVAFCALGLCTLGLIATSYADRVRAAKDSAIINQLVGLQQQSRWHLEQAQSQAKSRRPVKVMEIAQLEAPPETTPTPAPVEAAAPEPAKPPAQSPFHAEIPAGEPQMVPNSLSLNPDITEQEALPQVPRTEEELAGVAGGAAAKPAPGSIEEALEQAAKNAPSEEPADPDERRIARAAFEQAGRDFAEAKWKEAKANYEKVLKFMPRHPAALVNLGLVEERLGNAKDAQKHFEDALSIQPDAQPALMSLGLIYSKSGDLTKAMARLTRLVELAPKNAKAHNHLGVVFAQKTWREAAEAEFRVAIELDPLYQDAHFNLALMYLERTPPAVELARRHYNTAKQLGASPDKEVEAMLASALSLLPGEKPTASMP
jgi:tetratricopeptide (TPR) repeat protein